MEDLELEIEKFGAFFGSHFSDESIDRMVNVAVRPQVGEKLARQERALSHRKWFDYRTMHFGRATLLFAHIYDIVLREMYRRHFDERQAKYIKAFKVQNIFKGPQNILTGVFRARQFADAIGMPYDLYISTAMEEGMRYKREYMPRPTQLFSDRIILVTAAKWKERQQAQFFEVKDPRFLIENYHGYPDQDAHQAWVMEQAANRVNPEYVLSNALHNTRVIPARLIEEWFGPDMLERVERVGAS